MPTTIYKDPDAVLDYSFDWKAKTNGTGKSNWLADDEAIASHTLTIPDGITKDSDSADDSTVTVWLSGGTGGNDYKVVCRITTDQGRKDDRTMVIRVQDR